MSTRGKCKTLPRLHSANHAVSLRRNATPLRAQVLRCRYDSKNQTERRRRREIPFGIDHCAENDNDNFVPVEVFARHTRPPFPANKLCTSVNKSTHLTT